jgi:hypothetical protein
MHPTTDQNPSILLNLFLLLLFIVPAILFVLTQQNTLKAIRPENRLVSPGLVWLQFIPIFGQVWQFIVVTRIAGSAVRQRMSFRDDSIIGLTHEAAAAIGKQPTMAMGIIYCSLEVICILFLFTTLTPTTQTIHGLVALAEIICWIIYWVQLGRLKIQLTHPVS